MIQHSGSLSGKLFWLPEDKIRVALFQNLPPVIPGDVILKCRIHIQVPDQPGSFKYHLLLSDTKPLRSGVDGFGYHPFLNFGDNTGGLPITVLRSDLPHNLSPRVERGTPKRLAAFLNDNRSPLTLAS